MGWMIGVKIPAGAGNFSIRHRVQTGSGAHPSIADVKECVELYLHSSNTSSWRGA
jgi:hypothetical protein